jgi:putative spermidine/putrescine transport system ATP-binding protein
MARGALDRIAKQFGTRAAVDDIDLTVEEGEILGVVGPSGCGKTTTLRTIAGFETPTAGRVLFDEEDMTHVPPEKRNVGLVFQSYALFNNMSVIENVAFGPRMRGVETEQRRDDARDILDLLDIPELADRNPQNLSGGQKQRVALGRALAIEPRVLLLDEPMTGLDATLKRRLQNEVVALFDELDMTAVHVTHDQEEAMTMSTLIALMRDGRLEQLASPLDIFESPANEFSAQFIGQPPMTIVNGEVLDENRLSILDGQAVFELSDYEGDLSMNDTPSPVRVGFRPKDIVLSVNSDKRILTLDLDVAENLGDEFVLHLESETGEKIDALTENEDLIYQDTIGISSVKNIYLFDQDTGDRLTHFSLKGVAVPK